MKRSAMALLLALLACALGSCAGSGVPVETAPVTTLPPATVSEVAPIGDAALEYAAPTVLYLPRHDGTRLTALTTDALYSASRLQAESVARALLGYAGDGVAAPLGGDVRLSLYGANPVEVSGGVATVHLAASALQLDRKAFYLACQAVANTLTELSDIRYVCVQVTGKQLGLDVASTLPTGAFSRAVGTDVGAAYDQALSQRATAGEDASAKRLTAVAALYYPLAGLDGVVSEARSVSFESQSLSDMATRLLRELSTGSRTRADAPALPLLAELLTEPPTVLEGDAGMQVTLRFDYAYDDMLAACGVSRASGMASLCYTLSTFLPNVTGVTVYVGPERVDALALAANLGGGTLRFENGAQTRGDYAAFLLDDCVLYFPDGDKLAETRRPVAYYQTRNPRFLLLELFKGPQPYDSVRGLAPVLPTGSLGDAALVGLSLSDGALAVHFAAAFADAGRELTSQGDRLLAYALVNTLARVPRVRRVCFFVAGESFPGFTSEIYWPGYFYPNAGIVR